jgi:hypothetical protein
MAAVNTNTREEAAKPLGVIGCLTAGFEILSQNLWLIALPVLLDLFLWLGPRLSIAPLLQGLVAMMRAQRVPDPQAAYQWTQAADLLQQFGEKSNLLSLLGTLPLLDVPSLLAQHAPGMLSPLGDLFVFPVTHVLTLIAWAVLLTPVGLLLGFVYMNGLARRVAARTTAEEPEQDAPSTGGAGKLVRIFLFVAVLLGALLLFVPLWVALIGVVSAIAQPLGILTWVLGAGVLSYVALHLLFVVHGVLLGGRGLLRAVWESILLFQLQFPSVAGLLLLVVVVYKGLGYAWSLPPGDSWLLMIGILGNSCVATGLTAATFVFYQERMRYLLRAAQAKGRSTERPH